MSFRLEPPFCVVMDAKGIALVSLPLVWGEKLKSKLTPYGFPCELLIEAQEADGAEIATLNFGPGVDVARLQRTIDSLSKTRKP